MATIAVVEDHAIVGEALRVVLRSDGHDVVLADDFSFDAVLALVDETRADIVVLDLFLTGVESTALIAPLTRRGTPVLVLTACDDPRQLGDCLEAGAVATLSKSDGLDHLLDAVGLTLAGSAVMRPSQREALIRSAAVARGMEAERASVIGRLTARERLVLQHLAAGRSAEEIARSEFVSLTTVRTHIRAVLSKLGVKSQLGAVAIAHRAGWVSAA